MEIEYFPDRPPGRESAMFGYLWFQLRTEGDGCRMALLALLKIHATKAKADPLLFLFFGQEWLAARGFKAWVECEPGAGWFPDLALKILRWLGPFVLHLHGVDKAFAPKRD
jgi:hypothetical protein